jgi:hypothetical protein
MKQITGGALYLIAHCADNSYRCKAMKGNIEEDEDEVEDEYSLTSLSNNSEEENESTDTAEHDITEVQLVRNSMLTIS